MQCCTSSLSEWLKKYEYRFALGIILLISGNHGHVGLIVKSQKTGCAEIWDFWPQGQIRQVACDNEPGIALTIPVAEDQAEGVLLAVETLGEVLFDRDDPRYAPLPYSVVFSANCQLDNLLGFLGNSSKADGFTCASFVADLLHVVNLPAIKKETWEPRSADAVWQRHLASRLSEGAGGEGLSSQALDAQRTAIDGRRIHPEEIAAAAACEYRPLDFKRAVELGSKLRNAITAEETEYCSSCA